MSDQKTFLYRARDAAGQILYIGITRQPSLRMATHLKSAPWKGLCVGPFEWVEYGSQQEAAAAEKQEIEQHRPQYNKRGNPDLRDADAVIVSLNMNIQKATRNSWKLAAIDLGTDVTTLVHIAVSEYLEARGISA